MNDNKPNLFIVGAAKAGTTSLYHYIHQHPQVYMSPVKEPHFFGTDIQRKNFNKKYREKTYLDIKEYLSKKPLKNIHIAYLDNIDDYLHLFDGSDGFKIKGEASTSYLFSQLAAREIYNFNSNAKIIILLRNPVERTLSHYFMDVARGVQKLENIREAIEADYNAAHKGWGIAHSYIELSLYYEQVKRYLDVFSKDQVLILRYKDLNEHRNEVLQTTFNFLDIPLIENVQQETVFNETLIPKNNIVGRLKFLKKFLPGSLAKRIKNKSGFMFKARKDLTVSDDTKAYIESLVAEDWLLTQALIASRFNKVSAETAIV